MSVKRKVYEVELPNDSEPVVFVNGMVARNLKSWLWMFRSLRWIKKSVMESSGCFEFKAGIVGLKEVVVVSCWVSDEGLKDFFKSKPHQKMMKYVRENPDDLALFNETYAAQKSGKYTNESNGLAKLKEIKHC